MTAAAVVVVAATGLPSLTAKFQAMFVCQGKEMYTDPPLPTPGGVVIKAESTPPPKQNALTGELMFVPRDNEGIAGLIHYFCPNRPVVLPLLLWTAVFQQRQGHVRQRRQRTNCRHTRLQRRRAIRRHALGVQSK